MNRVHPSSVRKRILVHNVQCDQARFGEIDMKKGTFFEKSGAEIILFHFGMNKLEFSNFYIMNRRGYDKTIKEIQSNIFQGGSACRLKKMRLPERWSQVTLR